MHEMTKIRGASIAFAGNAGTDPDAAMRGAGIVLVALGILFFTFASEAADAGRNGRASPEMKQWIQSLTDKDGIQCCTAVDGLRPERVEWKVGVDSYFVKVDGAWLFVPDEAVIKGPNLLGHAVVWIEPGGDLDVEKDTALVRCFLPGAAS